MPSRLSLNLLLCGFTAVFIGYLSVWLPGPAAGLSFLGFELGEWVKFMGVGLERNLFYLPPIILGLMLVMLTLPWSNGRWQTWAMRGLAIGISLLAFPALEDITGPSRQEYMPRIQWIGLVVAAAVAATILGWTVKQTVRVKLCWLLLAALSVIAAVQPMRIYMQIQPNISQLFGVAVGFGWGFLLYEVGNILIAIVGLWQLAVGKSGN